MTMTIKMKKTLGSFLALLLVFPLLSSCHGKRETVTFNVPEEFDTEKEINLVFWAKNDTNINQTRVYEKACSDFHALYPNVTVEIKPYTDYVRIYNDVITNIATGTTPNVCITYPDHIATYITGKDVVVPLDALAKDKKYGLGGSEVRFDSVKENEIIPEFLSECRIGDTLYALPYMRSTEACYINRDFVEALGYTVPEVLTWDYIWEVSEKAAEKNEDGTYKVNGQKVMIPFIYKSTDNMLITMLKQKGFGYSSALGEVQLFSPDTKSLLSDVASHVKSGAFSTFKISGYPANFLNAGQCVFAIDSTAGATWMGAGAPLSDISEDKKIRFNTEVRLLPQYDPEHPVMISQGPSLCIFGKEDPQEVLASWLFAQYLLTNEVQIAYAGTEGYIPVTEKAHNSEEYKDYLAGGKNAPDRETDTAKYYDVKLTASRLLLENTKNTFTTPVFNGSAMLRDAAGQLVESTVKSVRRKEKTDDAYYEKLYADTSSLYHLDGDLSGGGKVSLGELPTASKVLLLSLAAVWALLIFFYLFGVVREKKRKK